MDEKAQAPWQEKANPSPKVACDGLKGSVNTASGWRKQGLGHIAKYNPYGNTVLFCSWNSLFTWHSHEYISNPLPCCPAAHTPQGSRWGMLSAKQPSGHAVEAASCIHILGGQVSKDSRWRNGIPMVRKRLPSHLWLGQAAISYHYCLGGCES